MSKRMLSAADLDAQAALELPDRESLQTLVVQCLAVCVGKITIKDINVAVVAQVCASVQAIAVLTGAQIACFLKTGGQA
jgi:hypothetical protein